MELKIAQIQMPVTADREENIRCACDMVRQAGDIDMAVLPEMFCCPYDNACFRPYGEAEGGPAYRALSALARERGIWLVGGTLPELAEDRVYNTCYVFAPDGQQAMARRYRQGSRRGRTEGCLTAPEPRRNLSGRGRCLSGGAGQRPARG